MLGSDRTPPRVARLLRFGCRTPQLHRFIGAPGDQLDDFVRKEMVRWAKVIKDNNIKSGD
ncbi:MAG: hypothetical protein H0T80_10045 [Betaproteobacteria bacterium]|nr:hypothetical protein [Betaproteobacteria bacterium]